MWVIFSLTLGSGNSNGLCIHLTFPSVSLLCYLASSSHYQVVAVLLWTGTTAQDNGLAAPDTDYPNLSSLEVFSYSDTADCPNPGLAQQRAYIAAEFSQALFPENNRYVVGDSTQPSDVDEYVNGPLCYGAAYTFFLREYVGEPGSWKRQTGRDYTVFSSSDFTSTVSTRMSQTYWTPF